MNAEVTLVPETSKVQPCFDKEIKGDNLKVEPSGQVILNSGSNEEPQVDLIGRQLTRSDGVYVEGAVQGTKVCFTADTGAARTVVSTKLFRQIPEGRRPKLEKSSSLAGANGQPLVELGKAVFTINLGPLTLERELVVAEIEDEALLGLDVLMKGPDGPADIKLTEGVIILNGRYLAPKLDVHWLENLDVLMILKFPHKVKFY